VRLGHRHRDRRRRKRDARDADVVATGILADPNLADRETTDDAVEQVDVGAALGAA
jgi:hypothetical protein